MQIPQGWFLLSSFFSRFFGDTNDGVGVGAQREFHNHSYPRDPNQCTNATEIIEFIFRILNPANYNRHKVPGFGSVTVRVEMWIQEVTTVSEITQDFEIDLYINEFWMDPALNYQHLNPCRHNISLDKYVLQKLWTPNTCFINSKKASIHTSPFTNVFLMIFPNGTLWGNYRVKLTGPCHMDLKRFPMDIQSCFLTFESYNYNTDDVRMKWTETPIIPPYGKKIELPDFTLVNFNAVAVEQLYPAGWWDELTATFVFRRRYGWYILQGYIPTYLTIFISWISFYLGVKAIPARTMIGVNSLLAMTMMFGNIIRNLPRVSYVKAIDVWMLSCMSFVFLSLLELATVGYLSRNIEHAAEKLKQAKINVKRDQTWESIASFRSHSAESRDFSGASGRGALAKVKYSTIERRGGRKGCCSCCGNFICTWSCVCKCWEITPEKIDKVSAVLFPTCFFIFNVFYWGYYLGYTAVDAGEY